MPTSKFLPYINAIQYDGMNSAEILGLIPNAYDQILMTTTVEALIVSEAGGTLVLRQIIPEEETVTVTLDEGDWLQVPGAGSDLSTAQYFRAADGNPLLDHWIPDPS